MAESEKCWFDPDLDKEDDRGQLMIAVADRLDTSPIEAYRQDLNLALLRLFESQPIASLNQYAGRYYSGAALSYGVFSIGDQATWNVARSVSMTAAAMIGRNRPRARFLTVNGKFKQKHRAKQAGNWAAGWANEANLYSVTFDALVASMWSDISAVQIYEGTDNRIHVEKVFGSELRFDPFDALYGSPRTLYRRRFIAKDVLIARYGKGNTDRLNAIEKALCEDPIGIDQPSGMIRVEEAWHLQTSAKAKDGYHVIAIQGLDGTLLEEPYEKPYFPIVILSWDKAQTGAYGLSLCTQLEPIQRRINKMLDRWDRASHLMAVPRVAIKRGSKIVKSSLSNLIAGAIEYNDTPPTPLVWPIMPPEYYKMLEDQVQKAYDLPGISRNAAQGQKEAGTTSAVAIREALDVQATRIQIYQQTWEKFHCDIFKIAIDMASDIVADKAVGKYEVKLPGSGMLSKADWKNIEYDEENYECTIWPVSILPITPQGRLDFVGDMLKSGMWDLDRARAAMSDLDTDSAESLENSVFYLMASQFENMLYEGKPAQPDEFTPFTAALKMGGQYLAEGQLQEAPAKNCDLIRRYLQALKSAQNGLNTPQQAAPGAPGAPPAPTPLDNVGAPLSPLQPGLAGAA